MGALTHLRAPQAAGWIVVMTVVVGFGLLVHPLPSAATSSPAAGSQLPPGAEAVEMRGDVPVLRGDPSVDLGWKSYDHMLLDVADEVPGFAGLFGDLEDGTVLNVRLTGQPELARARQARDAAARALDTPAMRDLDVRALPAQFTWQEMHEWHMRLFTELTVDWIFLDNDERTNQLVVGVEDPGRDAGAVRAEATSLGVPARALEVVQADPPIEFSSLRDFHRPLVGGLQIVFRRDGSNKSCTLGVPARYGDLGWPGFITASHCSIQQGHSGSGTGGDGTVYGQPNLNSQIGHEVRDGWWWLGTVSGFTCPTGRMCRFADVAFSSLAIGVTSRQGSVAWPPAEGSFAWDGSSERRIIGRSNPAVPRQVAKVGRTTGTSLHVPQYTCRSVNTTVHGVAARYVCQTWGSNVDGAAGGDSGAPVIRRESGAVTDADLKGILRGALTVRASGISGSCRWAISCTPTSWIPASECAQAGLAVDPLKGSLAMVRRHGSRFLALCIGVALAGCGPEDVALQASAGPPDCEPLPERDYEADEAERARWEELGWPEGPTFDLDAFADVEAYVAEHRDSYAGMWGEDIWDAKPLLVVAFSTEADDHEEALRALVGERGRVRIVDVQWSHEELWAVQNEIDALDWPVGGADQVTIGIDERQNVVDVGVDRITPELRAEFGWRFPAEMVCLSEAHVHEPWGGGDEEWQPPVIEGD